MSKLRPKIVQLAKMVGGISGVVNKIDENAPEYYSLADILTDEEADVAIAAGLRKNRTVEYLARKTGKSIEETQRIADRLAWIGVFRRTYEKEYGQNSRLHLPADKPTSGEFIALLAEYVRPKHRNSTAHHEP